MPIVSVGSAFTTSTVQSTATSAQSNIPITFGQAFTKGEFPALNAAVELRAPDNSVIPCQIDIKRTNSDGSVRHAVISAIIPSLGASDSVTYSIVRAASAPPGTPPVPADFPGLAAVAQITPTGIDLAGPSPAGLYIADAASKLANGEYETWLSGPICSEWLVRVPLVHGTFGEHPDLHVRFNIRAYKGTSKAKIDYIVENNWAKPVVGATSGSAWQNTGITDQIYRCSLYASNGAPVHTRNAQGFISVRAAVGAGIYSGTATGLQNDDTVYTAVLQVNGSSYPISITGSAAQNYTQLFALIRAQCNNLVTCQADKFAYNFEIRTEAAGASAHVIISDYGTLFPALRYSGLSAATNPVVNYTAVITVNGSLVKNISIPGSQAQKLAQVAALLTAQMDGDATAVPDLAGAIALKSTATGLASDVVVTDPGTLFPILSSNKLQPCRPIHGNEVVHYAGTRWKESFWWGAKPSVHIAHDKQYLIESGAVPNYPLDLVGDPTVIANNLANMKKNEDLMDNGITKAVMGDVGYAPGIGILPEWQAMYVINQGADAKYVMLKQADRMGAWPVCLRDHATDLPISFEQWPNATLSGVASDSYNPVSKLTEKLPLRIASAHIVGNRNSPDVAHHPDFNFVPYLVTGDHFYMEGMLFYQRYTVLGQNPASTYRNGRAGLFRGEQVRAQGWAIRTLVHALYLVPDGHPLTADMEYNLEQNRLWYEANYLASDAPLNNHFGAIINGYSLVYEMGAVGDKPKAASTGLAPWMDDFVTSAYGRALELGFEQWRALFNYKTKMPVGRLTSGADFCWQSAPVYSMRLRDTQTSPYYTSWSEVYLATLSSAITSQACGSSGMATALGVPVNSMTGYPNEIGGYPSNLQPAVAYAATHKAPGGENAWEVFDSRTVKPNYNTGPQFAIIPRAQEASIVAAPPDNYSVASGQSLYFGQNAPSTALTFDSLTFTDGADVPWAAQNGRPLVFSVHGSSGANTSNGRQWRAQVSGKMAFEGINQFGFSLVPGFRTVNGQTVYHVLLRPIDNWPIGGSPLRESMHIGFKKASDGRVYLVSEHRYDALLAWMLQNLTQYDLNKRVITGGSMGGWGSVSFGVRRYNQFAAIYPDRPRWRYSNNEGQVAIATLESGLVNVAVGAAPLLAAEDGGTSYAAYVDMIAYISNPANKVRPILWCCGRNDGFALFSEQIAAVDALRATKRAFAFAWNDGNHSTGSIMNQLLDSYPYGTYSLDKGYPLFTEHSLDKDPRVDLVGEINGGLSFRNVVENAGSWSCEVTSLRGACTVKVEPISEAFRATVTPQLVTIPAANTWVPVSFSA